MDDAAEGAAVAFWCAGIPEGQGSMRAFVRGGRARVVHNSPRALGDWRGSIATAARGTGKDPFLGPLQVVATFYLPRPRGHYGKRGLLPSAPLYPAVTPDLDKMLRALLDALTGVLWLDDKQVVQVWCSKAYTTSADDDDQRPGVSVIVAPMEANIA